MEKSNGPSMTSQNKDVFQALLDLKASLIHALNQIC